MYTSAYIEEEIIVRTISHTYSKYGSHSHYWNDEDHVFDYQLDQWGVDNFFHNTPLLILDFSLCISVASL